MSIEFLVTSLIVVASPGTGALVTVGAGLSRGARAAIVAALGCTFGILPHRLCRINAREVKFEADENALAKR
ncbi:hypothetical protein [Paraburkholderia sp. EG304]|uniref:hypothetical protein n=1 Tax=Paraburkholderia sp. EG304 TaxID=3237015 RepID=UPI00397DE7F5